jgi:hypothetical protein
MRLSLECSFSELALWKLNSSKCSSLLCVIQQSRNHSIIFRKQFICVIMTVFHNMENSVLVLKTSRKIPYRSINLLWRSTPKWWLRVSTAYCSNTLPLSKMILSVISFCIITNTMYLFHVNIRNDFNDSFILIYLVIGCCHDRCIVFLH